MKSIGLQTHIWNNNIRSLVLLGLFPIVLSVIIFCITFASIAATESKIEDAITISTSVLSEGFLFIVLGVFVWFIVAWAFHKQMILGMTKSKPLSRKDHKVVYDIVQKLCISRGAPMPKLYIIEDESMNAFASGLSPKNSLISFSRGLLNQLNEKEIEAVAAHELSHILNRDIRLMVISIIFVGIIQTIAEVFLRVRITNSSSSNKNSGQATLIILILKVAVYIIAFLISILIQLAISRKREYLADAGAVELTKTGSHLASALKKISTDARIEAIENRQVAQLCIEDPLAKKSKKMGLIRKLFLTHPPIEDRIQILNQLS